MLSDVRQKAGLGSPPQSFTTNASESLNAAIKKKVNHKETEWPLFNEQYISAQREETIRAISGRGQYRLTDLYNDLSVPTQNWMKMTTEQRKNMLKRFDSAKVKLRMQHVLGHLQEA